MEARDYVNDLVKWGLTQAQIAERSGVPQPTISKIARGTVEDVLSRNYRSLQAVHAEEAAKQAEKAGAAGGANPAAQGA
jgi:predicted transcriptional regulator